MANKKISELTAKGTAIAATDLLEISESDGAGGYVTKSVTGANLSTGGGGGVHILTKPVSGRSYGVRTNATTANSSSSLSPNVISLYPFIPANSITISNLQLNVAGTAAANIRILVYSDLNGVPSSKLIESTNLDASTSGVKTFTTSYTFTAGTVYWLGCYSSASVSVSVLKNGLVEVVFIEVEEPTQEELIAEKEAQILALNEELKSLKGE